MLPKFVRRFDRLIAFALIVIVALAAFALLHSPPPKPRHCTTEACFNPAFSSCAPATFNYTTPNAGTIRYQIVGSVETGSGCKVTVSYTDYPPYPALENKPMTCTFNNQVSIKQSASAVYSDLQSGKNTYGCTGPLAPVIQQFGSTK